MGPTTTPSKVVDALSSSPEIYFPGAPHFSTTAASHHGRRGAVEPSMFEVIYIDCSPPHIDVADENDPNLPHRGNIL
jgi:hypothetical protein